MMEDGTLRVQVVQQRNGTFSDFGGYDADRETEVTTNHDTLAVDVE